MRIAVIGAGISGVSAARQLMRAGHEIQVFEKSRGIGGRMSTLRTDCGSFDHGAQYFTARDPDFQDEVRGWVKCGVVKLWDGPLQQWQGKEWVTLTTKTERFVGVPSMNAPVKHLANGLNVRAETIIKRLAPTNRGWRLHSTDAEYQGFDAVIVSAPCEQTRELIGDLSPGIAQSIESLVMKPVWALMLSFSKRLDLPFDGCFVNLGPLSWVARNTSKPDRDSKFDNWVVHAGNEWSERHLEESKSVVERLLLEEFQTLTGNRDKPQFSACHKWRFSIPEQPLAERFIWDEESRIGVCGDWCGGPKVEGAFLSGVALASRIVS